MGLMTGGPGGAHSLAYSGTWITLASQSRPMKGDILPIQGGDGWFFQCHSLQLSFPVAQQMSEGHWSQREKVDFPEELDSLILLIRTGPQRPQSLSSDE